MKHTERDVQRKLPHASQPFPSPGFCRPTSPRWRLARSDGDRPGLTAAEIQDRGRPSKKRAHKRMVHKGQNPTHWSVS